MSAGVRVRVPASSANLGAGFDALGLALGLHDVLEVRPGSTPLAVVVSGEGAGEVPLDETHLVVRALRAASAHLGHDPGGLELTCANAIPHARGLGSSAAAIVAGIAAGYGLAGVELAGTALEDALHLAAEFEGHADNVAASLLGGLVLAWTEETTGRFRAARVEPHPDLRPVAIVPAEQSATHVTRGLLPEVVPHTDAAFAAGRAALAVHAIAARPDLLLPATADTLHQDYREKAWPDTLRVVRDLRARGVAAAVSGAGPTVLALTTDGVLPAALDLTGFTVIPVGVDRSGVRVDPLG
ncbi:homoserine kinase [Actinokineospora globicatena]|uniref:homoserine kinase n=1 Tax=Actinokineospora globicatena TaxID=103729 RepID=UPI0020A45725|nr:homoserine kinase [Actinokineospora globicatena]MCP2302426.1 homoserine kinase [Actinokineospora globicatena]GLW75894.1 homoserine kinase [Actinokineospora globicatena]GLW82732.1 homoserine kinase [Actinokineospora globicatena]